MKWFIHKYVSKRGPNTAPASKAEAKELRALARQIKKLDIPALDKETKSRIASDIGFGYHSHRKTFVRSWEGAVAALLVIILVFAQSAKPGSALYSVKRGTDKVKMVITQNVPLLDRFDDSPGSEDSHNTKTDDTKVDNGGQDGSNKSSGSDDSSGSSSGGATESSGHSGGTDDGSSGQGSSGPVPTVGGSGSSGHDGSSGGSSDGGGNSGPGKDSSKPVGYQN
jgi:hypothetical protein